MKSLLRGEQIKEIIPVQTKFGSCTLYFTNLVVSIESATKGHILEVDYESILSFQPIDKKCLRLVWSKNSFIYNLIIDYEKSEYIANIFKKIQTITSIH